MSIPLVLKELRETAWMAAIALVVYLYSVGLFVRIGNFGGGFWDDPSIAVPFSIEGSVILVIVGMCLAISLGLRQTVGERAHETFQFLLHRPPGLRWLIGTKLLVGVGLYLLVAGVPLLLCIWWAATRGPDEYPFKWAMTRLAWQGWLAGSILYLGAFLAGLRPARWFGTRLLLLIASVGLAGFFTFFSWPWAVGTSTVLVLDVLLVVTIFFVAQTRDFSWFGGLTSRPGCIWRPCFLAALVAMGFGIAWIIVASVAVIIFRTLPESPHGSGYREIEFGLDGMPIYWHDYGAPDGKTETDGEPGDAAGDDGEPADTDSSDASDQDEFSIGVTEIPGPPASRRRPWFRKGDIHDLFSAVPSRSYQACSDLLAFWSVHLVRWPGRWLSGHAVDSVWEEEHFLWRMEKFHHSYDDRDGHHTYIYAYLVPHDRTDGAAYFEAHESVYRNCKRTDLLYYIGRNGVAAEKPSPENCFSLPASPFGFDSGAVAPLGGENAEACYLLSGDRVVKVSFRERSVRVIWGSSEAKRPRTIQLVHASNGNQEVDVLVVRCTSEIVVLDLAGKEIARFIIPEAIRQKTFRFHLSTRTSAATRDIHRVCETPFRMYRSFRLDSEGGVEKEPSVVLKRQWWRAGSVLSDSWADAIALPAPAVFTHFAMFRRASGYADLGECPDYPAALAVVFSHGWPALVSVSLLSVALAWVCYRRQKRYGQRWTWLWVGFVFLFGLPGWVGYRFQRRWPPLEPCPNCGTAVPRDREACCRCGQDFPSPALKGTEIFA